MTLNENEWSDFFILTGEKASVNSNVPVKLQVLPVETEVFWKGETINGLLRAEHISTTH